MRVNNRRAVAKVSQPITVEREPEPEEVPARIPEGSFQLSWRDDEGECGNASWDDIPETHMVALFRILRATLGRPIECSGDSTLIWDATAPDSIEFIDTPEDQP